MEGEIEIQVLTVLDAARFTDQKEGTKLRRPVVRGISRDLFQEFKQNDKEEIFTSCEKLLTTQDRDARLFYDLRSGWSSMWMAGTAVMISVRTLLAACFTSTQTVCPT